MLTHKLLEMKIRVPIVLRIIDYLTKIAQFVRIGANVKSETKNANTGAPKERRVLSPFLFSLHTADCRGQHTNRKVC